MRNEYDAMFEHLPDTTPSNEFDKMFDHLPDERGNLGPVIPQRERRTEGLNDINLPQESSTLSRFVDAASEGFSKGFGKKPVFDETPTEYFPPSYAPAVTNAYNHIANTLIDSGEGVLRGIGGLVRAGTHTIAQATQEMGMSEGEASQLERDLAGMVDTAAIMGGPPSALNSSRVYKVGAPATQGVMKTSKNVVELPGKAVPNFIKEPAATVKDSLKRPFQADDTVAADILNKTLERAGKTPDDIVRELNKGQEAAKFGPNSKSILPESLADLGGEATQSLLEQTIIAPGKTRTIVREKINNKQRGVKQPYSTEKLPDTVNEVQSLFSQRERLLDNLARSLEIKGSGTALKTDKQIAREIERQANPMYEKAFNQADDFDVSRAIANARLELEDMSGGIRSSMKKAIDRFDDLLIKNSKNLSASKKLIRFDNAKKALDDMISKKVRSGQSEAVRSLTIFKKSLLNTVHGGDRASPTMNTYYATARDFYSEGRQMQDAINKGRNAFKEGSELTSEMVKGMSQSEIKMLRLGFYDAVKRSLGRKKSTDDSTQLFRQAEFAELHKAIAPHKKKRNSEYKPSDQFGELLSREHRMVETKNMLGNSRTAFRLEGQKDFDRMAAFSHRMQNNGLASAIIDSASLWLQSTFGMRETVAARLADLLTSTDPNRIKQAMSVIKRNYGDEAADQSYSMLAKMVADNESAVRAGYIAEGSRN